MPLRTSTANYTSLLSNSQRSAFFQDRLRRIGVVLVIVIFGLLILFAIFLAEGFNTRDGVDTKSQENTTPSQETILPFDEDAQHQRFLFPDWRLGLGWNNVRYELEHHIFYAHLLDRTLIIPEEIHLRKCYQEALCSLIGRRIKDAAWDMEGGKDRWAIPIKHFIDLPHLKSKAKVLTAAEFIALQLRRANAQRNQKLAKALNSLLTSPDSLDILVEDGSHFATTFPDFSFASTDMFSFLHGQLSGSVVVDDLAPIERLFPENTTLARNATLHGFADLPNMTLDLPYNASVTVIPPQFWNDLNAFTHYPNSETPRKHVRQDLREWDEDAYNPPNSNVALKGFLQTWAVPPHDTPTLFHLSGEPHRFGYQPMKFTTPAGIELYRQIAFNWLRHAAPIEAAADFAWSRLVHLTGNNSVISFHLRRGDFSELGWNGVIASADQSATLVSKAYDDLSRRFKEQKEQNVTVGDLSPRFFLSTDDTTREGVVPLYAEGAVRLMDLLSVNLTNEASEPDEIQAFWDANIHVSAFGDWLGLVEQDVCSRAWFFVGTTMSSFSGGILNLRARAGRTPVESSFVDPWV